MGYDLDTVDQNTVLSHAKALALSSKFELCCAVDPNEERRNTFQSKYKAPAYSSLDEALQGHKVDLAVVAVPTESHSGEIQHLLRVGKPKAILCEKPIAYTLEESRALVSECAKSNVSLHVNYMRRSEPGALEVKRRINQGTIAGPIKGVAWYTKGILHNGSHLINLCELWLGRATSFSIISKGASLGEYDATPDVSIHFKVGSVLFLANQEGKYSHHAIELLASNGYLRYDRSGHTINWTPIVDESNPLDQKSLSVTSEAINSQMVRYQSLVLENLALHMSDMPAHLCSGLQALETHGFIDKILRVRNEH